MVCGDGSIDGCFASARPWLEWKAREYVCAQDISNPLVCVLYWTLRDYSQSRTHYYVVCVLWLVVLISSFWVAQGLEREEVVCGLPAIR